MPVEVKKKIWKIVIIFLIALLIFALLEWGIKAIINWRGETVKNVKYEPTQSEIDQATEEEYLKTCIENIESMLQSKNYESLYAKVDETYSEYKFGDLDAFKQYIDTYIFTGTKVKNIKYDKNRFKIFLLVSNVNW